MSEFRLSPHFRRAVLKGFIALSAIVLPLDVTAQETAVKQAVADTAPPPAATRRPIVTWGDSIGNAIGQSISGQYPSVTNLGKDGSGLLIANRPQSLDSLPHNAVVFMSIGTNDVGTLMGQPRTVIDNYAARVVGLAQSLQARGMTPVIIGMQAPTGPYTGNMPVWGKPGYLQGWIQTMARVNTAIQSAAQHAKINYSVVADRVPKRAADNLHYTPDGSRRIAAQALQDAGLNIQTATPAAAARPRP